MHARDDHVVPFVLGEKLYQAAKASRISSSKPLFFFPFHGDLGYAHVLIHTAPELPNIVSAFIKKAAADKWDKSDYNGKMLQL
jgi:abhydrolase domain-containing protein 12